MKYFTAILAMLAATAFGQGSLNPAAAPAPTMKTLLELWNKLVTVETQASGIQTSVNNLRSDPRNFITSAPVTITNPGSYVLGANLSLASGTAITISADDVTLDLNGFAIIGYALPSSGSGIIVTGARRNIRIKNGSIKGTTTLNGTTFIPSGFLFGIYCDTNAVKNVSVSDVQVGGTSYGILLGNSRAAGTIVDRCTVNVAAEDGITANTVRASSATDCGDTAIDARIVSDSDGRSVGAGNGIEGRIVINSYGSSKSGMGIIASTITNSTGQSSSLYGVYGDVVSNCSGSSSDEYGVIGENVLNSFGTSTSGDGIYAFGNVAHSVGYSSTGRAIRASGTVSFSRGERPDGIAIQAGIAVGGPVGISGTVSSPSKHLGTP